MEREATTHKRGSLTCTLTENTTHYSAHVNPSFVFAQVRYQVRGFKPRFETNMEV